MLKRRQLFQIAGVAAVAGVGGAAWMYSGSRRSDGLAGGPFRHYPFYKDFPLRQALNAFSFPSRLNLYS